MSALASLAARLRAVPDLSVRENAPLAEYARFGIGGPAALLIDASTESAFAAAWPLLAGVPREVIGGGTNLIVSDHGFDGAVLRFTGAKLAVEGPRVRAEAGALLQHLVDTTMAHGLAGLHTMTGIPGWVGGAVYGNAGAYGNSIAPNIHQIRYFDGTQVQTIGRDACAFAYRESRFKRHKDWVILSAELEMRPGDRVAMHAEAASIRATRDKKYPPDMKCAGSIFKNLLWRDLPPHVQNVVPATKIIEGKVPSAYFLEAVGAKGMQLGGIHVADYHANLIYNTGGGTARELRTLIEDLKARVRERFGFDVEEEVQYVGF
jgi:UDP-N-acetylmuramate dehydrogenase